MLYNPYSGEEKNEERGIEEETTRKHRQVFGLILIQEIKKKMKNNSFFVGSMSSDLCKKGEEERKEGYSGIYSL